MPFPRARHATKLFLRVAAVVAAISGVAWLTEFIANMADGFGKVFEPETLQLFFTQTIFGPVAALRLVLLAAALILAILPARNRACGCPPSCTSAPCCWSIRPGSDMPGKDRGCGPSR